MSSPTISVVVPTFREAENLPVLIPRVAAALEGAGWTYEIVVVDDNSPDATRAVCAELARVYPVRLEVRLQERGLSSAVIHGIERSSGQIVVVMDADLSHPPESVPDLVRAVEEGAEFVIGSRYTRGGTTADGWGLGRWLNSKAATLMAWPLTSAADPMAGFFALPRAVFDRATELNPIGYKIGLELMVKAGVGRPREVPIRFENRLHGDSKLTLKEQINYVRHLKRLYEFKYGRVARLGQFVLVGGSGMVVDLVCFAALLTVLPLGLARAAAIWVAMTWNFGLNWRITFSATRSRPLPQYLKYCVSCGLGAAVNWTASIAAAGFLAGVSGGALLAALVGIAAGCLFNFFLCDLFVFRRAAGDARADHPTSPWPAGVSAAP
jgi:dolichol-phosphate mannosyltransferase